MSLSFRSRRFSAVPARSSARTWSSVTVAMMLLMPGILPRVAAQPNIHPEELELKPRIDAAIAKGVEAILKLQHRDGSWGMHGNQIGGRTAIFAYTLLKCGVQPDHPALRRAFTYLDQIEPRHTYATGCMMLAYGALEADESRSARLESLRDLLLDWQKSAGDWGYPDRHPDLSNTQYAALGFWAAEKCGVDVPNASWKKLVDGTLRYQEKVRSIKRPEASIPKGERGRTSTSKMRVGGFSYRPHQKPTGSMTTAGVSVLQIAKIGLDRKLGRGTRSRIDKGIEAGLAWLDVNFAVDKNPHKGDWHHYYLYGLERVGSLTRVEEIGAHWWYLEGARHLLEKQNGQGHWGKRDGLDTCFGLLFLRRASKSDGPTTGSNHKSDHAFTAGTEKDSIKLRGAGQQPLALWIDGFGEAVLKRHDHNGIRVLKVEYFDGKDAKLGECAGDPSKVWGSDAFLHRCTALRRGEHSIRARVTLLTPDAKTGDSEPTETLESPVMKVHVRDVFAPWMQTAAQLRRDNLIRGVKVQASASSGAEHAKLAHDGVDTTSWVCAPDDREPKITLVLDQVVKARRVLLTQPASREADVGKFDRIVAVEVRLNRDKNGQVIRLDSDPIALTDFELPATRRVRRVTLVIKERVHVTGKAGFAEIALAARSNDPARER